MVTLFDIQMAFYDLKSFRFPFLEFGHYKVRRVQELRNPFFLQGESMGSQSNIHNKHRNRENFAL